MVRHRLIVTGLGTAAHLGIGSYAFGQTGPDVDEKCRAEPLFQQEESREPGNEPSLTDTLEDCNGVLKPPVVGDSEISEPPPNVGETPIIRPGDVPAQPPSGD
jgi:hypothetical protein